jgi:hypothetical protein
MSVDTTTTTTTTSDTTAATPWARAQGFSLLAREGEWDVVVDYHHYFFDSHGELWETVPPDDEGAEAFGPRGASRRVTEEIVRAKRAEFDEWASTAFECDWCDGCGGGFRRKDEVEIMEDLLGLAAE